MISGLSPLQQVGLGSLQQAEGLAQTSLAKFPAAADSAQAADFDRVLAEALQSASDTLHKAESVSIAGIHGEVSKREVVDAVMAAEQTLQAAIAIRDKIVTAYLELSRMAI